MSFDLTKSRPECNADFGIPCSWIYWDECTKRCSLDSARASISIKGRQRVAYIASESEIL